VAAQGSARGRALGGQRRFGIQGDPRREVAAGDGGAAEDLAERAQAGERTAPGRSEEDRDDRGGNEDCDQRRTVDLPAPGADKAHFSRG
jgi:hypothetical protein